MGIAALTNASVTLPINGRWIIEVQTTDDDGYLVSGEPSLVVTLPAGSTTSPTFEEVTTGVYRAAYTVGTAGRYVARVTATDHGAVDLAAFVSATTAQTAMPTVDDVLAYLGRDTLDRDMVQDALDAEAAAQRARCRVTAVYPDDLRQALLRRVHRNVEMRNNPLAGPRGDADGVLAFVPSQDPEVRRLEAPYRRLVVG